MEIRINKKPIHIKPLVIRMLLQSFVFFVMLTIWQIMVFLGNVKTDSSPNNPIALVFLFASMVLWVLSYFEIRTLTANDQRFLGYKAYILFFYKLAMYPLAIITAILSITISKSVFVLILLISIWVIVYYILFVAFIRKYKGFMVNPETIVYICYQVRVKTWYREGLIS